MNAERFDAIVNALYNEIECSIEETARINRQNPYVPVAAGAALVLSLFVAAFGLLKLVS